MKIFTVAAFIILLQTTVVSGFVHLSPIGGNTPSKRALRDRCCYVESGPPCTRDLSINLSSSPNWNRREILLGSVFGLGGFWTSSLISPFLTIANADNSQTGQQQQQQRPFAPKEALLPAARVKLTIDKAIILTNSIIAKSKNTGSSTNVKEVDDILQELQDLLLKPQNYIRSFQTQGVPSKPANLYLNKYKPMKGDLPLQRMLIQSGDVSAWKDLKTKEKDMEKSNEIRAALNAYTDYLSFSSDTYVLNVDKVTKSNMVRNDRLPDIRQVITSDMGLRYLYRNQILTAMDDVKAELEYQLKEESSIKVALKEAEETQVDGEELLALLLDAQKAFDRWFSLIDPIDVKEALDTIESEENAAMK